MITHLKDNIFQYKKNDIYIEFELISNFNLSIVLRNNISDDGLLLISKRYQTLENENPIVGEVYKFDGHKCIGMSLVEAKIIMASVDFAYAKRILEVINL